MGLSKMQTRLLKLASQKAAAQKEDSSPQMKTERTQFNNNTPSRAENLLANLDKIDERVKNAFKTFS